MKTIRILLVLFFSLIVNYSCQKDDKKEVSIKSYFDYKDFVTDGLIAYYPFNENADDYSGSKFNGASHNVSYSIDRFGNPNSACMFKGQDSYIEIENSKALNDTAYTICFWYRTDAQTGNHGCSVLSKMDTDGFGYILELYRPDHFDNWEFTYKEKTYGSGGGFAFESDFREWYPGKNNYEFAAIGFSKTQLVNYLAGRKLTSSLPSYFNDNNYKIFIGRSDNTKYTNFVGEINDLLIYNRILTVEEVTKLYNCRKIEEI